MTRQLHLHSQPIHIVSYLSQLGKAPPSFYHSCPANLIIHHQINSRVIYYPIQQKATTNRRDRTRQRATHHPIEGEIKSSPTPVPVLTLVVTVVTGTAEHSYSPALSTVTLHRWIPARAPSITNPHSLLVSA